ncbi:hypothetical protein BJV74DRAFT_883048 [Russula compacta]|nr:hypothetical protein BJV74DRAFT_883048 [Russula compacta]
MSKRKQPLCAAKTAKSGPPPSSLATPIPPSSCPSATCLLIPSPSSLSSSLVASTLELPGSFPDSQFSTLARTASPDLDPSLLAPQSQLVLPTLQLQLPDPSTMTLVPHNSPASLSPAALPAPPDTATVQCSAAVASQSSALLMLQPSASQPPIAPVPQPLSSLI